MTRRLENRALSIIEVFQAQRLTPLALCVVRSIRESVLQEIKDNLGAVNLVTSLGIVLLDRVKEKVVLELTLQLQQH